MEWSTILIDAWAVVCSVVFALAVEDVFLLMVIPAVLAVAILGLGDALSPSLGWLVLAGCLVGGPARLWRRRRPGIRADAPPVAESRGERSPAPGARL